MHPDLFMTNYRNEERELEQNLAHLRVRRERSAKKITTRPAAKVTSGRKHATTA